MTKAQANGSIEPGLYHLIMQIERAIIGVPCLWHDNPKAIISSSLLKPTQCKDNSAAPLEI